MMAMGSSAFWGAAWQQLIRAVAKRQKANYRRENKKEKILVSAGQQMLTELINILKSCSSVIMQAAASVAETRDLLPLQFYLLFSHTHIPGFLDTF